MARRASGGKPKVTASDRETARQLCDALVVTRRTANVEEVARILAFLREQIVSVVVIAAERERAREALGHAAWCRTDGCDGSCREADVERLDEATILWSPRTERDALLHIVVQAIDVLRGSRTREAKQALSMLESAISTETKKG